MSRMAGDIPWQAPTRFDGHTYDPKRDCARISGQLGAVYQIMSDGGWWTIEGIQASMQECTTQSVSARIRDLRKPRFGGHTVERKSIGGGLFAYRLVNPK